jgi:predicted PurR-regulated permease PerM
MGFQMEAFYRHNRRAMTWIIFFVLLWMMRGFFSLIFLTFVISFLAAPLIRFAQQRLRLPRRLAIVGVFLLFALGLVSFVRGIVPQVGGEAKALLKNTDAMQKRLIEVKRNFAKKNPGLDNMLMSVVQGAINEDKDKEKKPDVLYTIDPDTITSGTLSAAESACLSLLETKYADWINGRRLVDSTTTLATVIDEEKDERLLNKFVAQEGSVLVELAPKYVGEIWRSSITLLFALLFSFLITMDTTRLLQELRNLKQSRLHSFYEETAQPIVQFGMVVGRAMQAQAMIAVCNTFLTVIGLAILDVPSLAVLSLIVFLCSFIPVLGVFLSTTPIALVALNAHGLSCVGGVILLVVIIHLVESYLLNPLIYGHHLKLNPVLVLMILFVGHHAFGVWGMLLGVPVAYYLIHDVFGVPLWKASEKPDNGI